MKWLALLLILYWLAQALRWRGRLAQVPRLEPAPEPSDAPERDFVFLVAEGARLDEATRRAAAAHARARGLDVLDLVPADLPAERLVVFATLYEPEGSRMLFSPGRTARVALAVSRETAERAGVEAREGLLPLELADLGRRLKLYAPRSIDAAVVPGLAANREDPRWFLAMHRAALGLLHPAFVVSQVGILVVLGLALVLAPLWGVAALLANHLAPALAAAGSPFRPRDLAVTVLLRAPRQAWTWLWMVLGPKLGTDGRTEEVRAKRPRYEAQLARGVDQLFEPRRPDCPLCGATDLATYIELPDMLQYKPGRFTIDRCGACGHLFQNPRLTIEGLDFYYADFYDGLGKAQTEAIFGIGDSSRYVARANLARGHVEPRTWLDVGGGYGHFCLSAKEIWPETRFDVLDMSDGVDEGVRRGWVERGYRGLFPELSGELPPYDVVSMSHYLEHTREPRDEIRAAATALREGGVLVIEMPNGVATTGKRLGRYWLPFFQPQHQHLPSLEGLERILVEEGFETLERQWGEAHSSGDYTGASFLLVKRIAGPGDVPWLPPGGALRRMRNTLGWAVGMPLLVVGFALDKLTAEGSRTRERSNAYRLVARRTSSGPARTTTP